MCADGRGARLVQSLSRSLSTLGDDILTTFPARRQWLRRPRAAGRPIRPKRITPLRPTTILLRLFEKTQRLRRLGWFGYLFGTAGFCLALAVRLAVDDHLVGYPYVTFFPVVVLTTFIGGIGAGIFTAAISGIASWWFFIEPEYSFAVLWPSTWLALGFYLLVVGVEIMLIHMMEISLDRLQAERRESARLADQHKVLFQELQHRVANNLAIVSSVLALQARRAGAGTPTATALDDARERLATMARIHRRLYDPTSAARDLPLYLEEFSRDLIGASGRDIATRVQAERFDLDVSRLTTLSLLVSELVTNALKHAFEAGRKGGEIVISLCAEGDERIALRVSDNGRGLPEGFLDSAPTGLGTQIVASLARQLGGEIRWTSEGGATALVTFPLDPQAQFA